MNRLKELDSLRGIACMFVLLFHFTTQYAKSFNVSETLNLVNFKYGGLGVDLFFIISGFVIFLTINRTKRPVDFVFKRFSRLYPTFWASVLLTFFVVNASDLIKYQRNVYELFVNLTMIPDVFGVRRVDGVYWSLLPELMFYLGIFVLFLCKGLKKIELVSFVWIALIVVNSFYDIMPLRVLLNLKFGYLFIMGICFYKVKYGPSSLVNHLLIAISYLVSFLVFSPDMRHLILLLFIIVFYLFVYGKLQWLTFKPLIFLGQISYALYLIHQFIGYVIITYLLDYGIENSFLLLIIPSVITILIAWVITDFVEKPIQSGLRNYWKKVTS